MVRHIYYNVVFLNFRKNADIILSKLRKKENILDKIKNIAIIAI